MGLSDMSIFEEYYKPKEFTDRFLGNSEQSVDVIIPVYHTNELWEANLIALYREVPVRRLLISDGGVIDDSIDIVQRFPRVEVFNHRQYKTLGKCIAELIKQVSSEWFIYVHSDVYLPPDWFDSMAKHQDEYDWYGCPMNITALINYRNHEPRRPYAGSQMGRKAAFGPALDEIDDDFVYRQEDFVFDKVVTDSGYKTGKVEDTFHYHQLMYRKSSGYDLNVTKVRVETNTSEAEVLRANDMQLRGIVKYLDPKEPYVIDDFKWLTSLMLQSGLISFNSFRKWIKLHNKNWLPYFTRALIVKMYYHQAIASQKKIIKKLLAIKN